MRLHLLTILFALAHAVGAEAHPTEKPSFVVVPPGPVMQGARLELRLAVHNPADMETSANVAFFLNDKSSTTMIGEQTLTIPAHGKGLAQTWYVAQKAGRFEIRYKVQVQSQEYEGTWRIEVHNGQSRALPYLAGMWIEPLAVIQCAADPKPEILRRVVSESVASMDRLGVRVLIVAYVEYMGQFYYPSEIEFFDTDAQRASKGADCTFDMVDALLTEADAHNMHVILGLGRSGDTRLLWEFDKPDWDARNYKALGVAKKVASELLRRYGTHQSLYGWYLTHEMNDLARASAYYDPLARFCHEIAPEKPVLAAPAGTPVITQELLAASAVDIFAYQDAVGAGYVPYEYTYRPERRIAMLDDIYTKYAAWHAKAGKHFWSDLELWEMNGTQGYGGSYPASFMRVKRQINIESRHAEVLTGYAYHGFLQAPDSTAEAPNTKAQSLYADYLEYLPGLLFRRER